jgi:hypothetical protein
MNLAAAAVVAGLAFFAQDKEKLRTGLKDTEVKGDWIYDDLGVGFAEAKKSGKPMMIVFR